jgi:hypothetical protein
MGRPDQPKENGRFMFQNAVPSALLVAESTKAAEALVPDLVSYEPEAPTEADADVTYPDWTAETSMVLSGPIGKARFPGRRANNWEQAKSFAAEYSSTKRVPLYKFWTVPGRWFARVGRTV